MSDITVSAESSAINDFDSHQLLQEPVHWLDRVLNWLSDRSSPLLVKETRQAIKSRQFFYTFLLLLVASLAWAYIGVMLTISYDSDANGSNFLSGYLWILALPMMIILPFTTFRSLIREFEDDTFQLASITNLSARGIIYGKLASAMLQMIVYLSAVVPGIAFSYLLQGVDLPSIFSLLLILVVSSVTLISFGLAIGGVGRHLFLRVMAHLVLLVVSLVSYFAFGSFQSAFLSSGGWEIPWEGTYCFVAITLGVSAICMESSVSANSFFADNRSSNVRLAVLFLVFAVVSAIFTSFSSAESSGVEYQELVWVLSATVGILMAFFGVMMATEFPVVSQRVRRSIPQAAWVNSFVALLLPGPGRGYLFSLVMIWGWIGGMIVYAPLYSIIEGGMSWMSISKNEMFEMSFVALNNATMATIYVSLTYLAARLIGTRIPRPAPLMGLVFAAILYIFSIVFSLCLMGVYDYLDFDRRINDCNGTNFFCWAFTMTLDGEDLVSGEGAIYLLFNFVLMAALVLICMMRAAREIALPHSMVPAKVQAEIESRRRVIAVRDEETIEELFQAHQQSPPTSVDDGADGSSQMTDR
ncbi:MAG: hypothetical protein KF851_17280 [Pirellulaceae bacterium]|nr:hypothetical protein [Pirellulaceae bacterium]